MAQHRQEDPSPSDVWRVGLQVILAASATALIGDASLPIVILVATVALLVFGIASLIRRRNRTLAAFLAVFAGRRRLAVALTVITGLLLVFAAYLVGVREERDANAQVASQVLLRVISPELGRSCSPLDDQVSVAAIACFDQAAGIRVRFFQYATPGAMNRAMDFLVAASSAPPGGCFTQAIGIDPYILDEKEVGRLWCNGLGERQHLAWTNEDLLILAKAEQTSSESASLMQWWSDMRTALSVDGLRQRFPDEYERRLLEHVPGTFRKSCERDDYSLPGSKATVRCLPKGGADIAYYLLLGDPTDLDRRVRKRRKDLESLGGFCSSGRQPAVSTYSDGTRFCYHEGNVSWIEWSDDQLLLYAFARREPLDADVLYGWWRHRGGPT